VILEGYWRLEILYGILENIEFMEWETEELGRLL